MLAAVEARGQPAPVRLSPAAGTAVPRTSARRLLAVAGAVSCTTARSRPRRSGDQRRRQHHRARRQPRRWRAGPPGLRRHRLRAAVDPGLGPPRRRDRLRPLRAAAGPAGARAPRERVQWRLGAGEHGGAATAGSGRSHGRTEADEASGRAGACRVTDPEKIRARLRPNRRAAGRQARRRRAGFQRRAQVQVVHREAGAAGRQSSPAAPAPGSGIAVATKATSCSMSTGSTRSAGSPPRTRSPTSSRA